MIANVNKCFITPIFGDPTAFEAFHEVLTCQIMDIPIQYLGVPLSTTALPKSQFRPLIDKITAKLPAWQGRLMNRSGRLTLIKSTLSAMPIYLTMSDKLPGCVIHEIDALRRNCLWSGKEEAMRGKNLVAWPTVCSPTDCGGSGVVVLHLSGFAGCGCNELRMIEPGLLYRSKSSRGSRRSLMPP